MPDRSFGLAILYVVSDGYEPVRKKNVSPPDRRSDANLSRGIYRPLEQRAVRDEPVLSRLHRGKRRLDVVDEDVKTYGQRDYERMYEV